MKLHGSDGQAAVADGHRYDFFAAADITARGVCGKFEAAGQGFVDQVRLW